MFFDLSFLMRIFDNIGGFFGWIGVMFSSPYLDVVGAWLGTGSLSYVNIVSGEVSSFSFVVPSAMSWLEVLLIPIKALIFLFNQVLTLGCSIFGLGYDTPYGIALLLTVVLLGALIAPVRLLLNVFLKK